MTEDVFSTYWPLVDSVYTKLGVRLLRRNNTAEVQKYESRLRKRRKSGTARGSTEAKKI